jgi:glycosyltransferase involved in cell wall biosynthesis
MDSPVVVVIPCYREPLDEVAPTIESALAVADRAIVVDDGAGQYELDSLRSDRVEVWHRNLNGGPAAALDDGIAAAPEDSIICRLDVRDRFYPDAKRRQIETVRSGQCRASASPHFDPVAGAVHTPHEKWRTLIYSVSQFTQMSTVFHHSVWREIGIDTSFRWAEDWRFCMLVEHHIGWEMFPEVTCSAGMFPGGYTDRGGSGRNADRKRVYKLGQVLGKPEKFAHLYHPEWCAQRGLTPLKRKS